MKEGNNSVEDSMLLYSNGFDSDIEGWQVKSELVFDDPFIHNQTLKEFLTVNLEEGKEYRVSYTICGDGKPHTVNIPEPKNGYMIDNVSIVEIIPQEKTIKVDIPKGMSPSFHHLMQKERKKKKL